MTSVLGATSKMMKKNCEALEKSNAISEKQLEVMEKHTEILKRNSEVMERCMEMMENQLNRGKRRSERIRAPSASSSSSDIIEIPLPPPQPPTPEPTEKKAKVEEVDSRWGPRTVSPWLNPPGIISSPRSVSLAPIPPIANQNFVHSFDATQRSIPSLLDNFNNPFKKSMNGCIYCGDTKYSHISEQCPNIRDSVSRTAFMKMNYLCLTCGEPKYRCPDPIRCRFVTRKCDHCVGSHLNALCNTKYPSGSSFMLE